MQVSFDALALLLVSFGFSPVLYCELYCQKDGGWRCAVTECDEMMPCPRCGTLRDATLLATGYTKHVNAWERWESPLSPSSRAGLLSEVDEAEKIRREERSGNGKPSHYQRSKLLDIDPVDFTWASRFA